MLARPASDVRQLGSLAYAPVCYVVSIYRKLLDQVVEFRQNTPRTRKVVPIQGCQTEDGSAVSCLGNIGKLNMMLRRKNARCLRKSCFIPSHATESRARYRMTLSQ